MTGAREPAGKETPPLEPLTEPARRAAARQRRAKGGKLAFFKSLALLGTIGWLIVGPLLLGVFGGRWVDRSLGGGLTWTLGGAFAGLVLGGWMAWRRLAEFEREERREQAAGENSDRERGRR